MDTVRIVLADDQDLVRGGLSALLALEPDIDVVGGAGTGDELIDVVRRESPDVALVDIEMPGTDGIEAIARLNEERTACRFLVVTTFGRPGYLRRAMEAGAAGFLVKDTPANRLAEMVRRVAQGYRVVDPALAADSLAAGITPLTGREQEALRVAARGGPIRQIAKELHLSEGTVRNHLSTAIAKTQAHNRHDAARIARDQGWL